MELTFAVQSSAFLHSILLGIILGAIYGVFKFVRTAFDLSKPLTFAADVLYMLISAVLIYLFILAYLSGYVRLYLLPGIIIGFALYRLTLGRLLCRFYNPVISLFRAVFGAVSKKFKIFAKKVLKKLRHLLYNRQVN